MCVAYTCVYVYIVFIFPRNQHRLQSTQLPGTYTHRNSASPRAKQVQKTRANASN